MSAERMMALFPNGESDHHYVCKPGPEPKKGREAQRNLQGSRGSRDL
jgi:hypothetical protein